ncbi:sulfatase-like hydrolase/transferase [Natronosalvus caseinilyticus]|uniref:sulfatase-like hydrolase/transferase n=1 Tax=Natronosalvus caseinilyticus TaxID=2953747 RepID=UPI0028A9D7C5|nr:sulfatase-like hydrolase/transferase [Natronosalvus caseinilyticus]
MTPNILLVVLDSVRARNTSLYESDAETTPFLEEFAQKATVYEQARAPGTDSLQSHASIFTGLHVAEHQMRDIGDRLRPGNTIWEELAADGYETGVFSYNSYLTQAPVGLSDAFETVVSGENHRVPFPGGFDPSNLNRDGLKRYLEFMQCVVSSGRPLQSLANGLALWDVTRPLIPSKFQGLNIVPDSKFTDEFETWVDNRNGSWAACVNYMCAHTPYLPDPEYNLWADQTERKLMCDLKSHKWEFIAGCRPWSERAALERAYNGCIRQVDAELKRLLSTLSRHGELNNTLVVITADHGEGFGEKGTIRPVRSVAHGTTGGLEEEILHVPLVVKYPNQTEGTRIKTVASLTEFPTLVRRTIAGERDESGFIPDNGLVLASDSGLSEQKRDSVPEYVEDVEVYEHGGKAVYRTTRDKRIRKDVKWNGNTMAFDCTSPRETIRLDDPDPTVLQEAFAGLEPSKAVTSDDVVPADDVKARLEQLGYR